MGKLSQDSRDLLELRAALLLVLGLRGERKNLTKVLLMHSLDVTRTRDDSVISLDDYKLSPAVLRRFD